MIENIVSEQGQNLKCLPARETDLDKLIELQYAACEDYPFHDAIWGTNTADNRRKARERLSQKWRETPDLQIVKCITSDTHELMAWCIWERVGAKSSESEAVQEDVMNDCAWLDGRARELARAYLIPALHKRWEIMRGADYFVLTNLCTAPRWRKQGAAQALVRWGLDRARAEGVPAYCEASEMGLEMYTRLGFKRVGEVETKVDGKVVDECAVMVAVFEEHAPSAGLQSSAVAV